jgi:hypothetical protein
MMSNPPLIGRKEFIETVIADLNDGEYVCLSTAQSKPHDPSQTWFNSYLEKDRFWLKWREDEQARAVYFCVSTVDGSMNEKGTMISRKRSNLVRAHVFVLDDIGTKTTEPPVNPSYKLESSEGNFQWGFLIEPTDRLAEYEALVEAVHGLGWGDGGAGGSYRLMRVPGSANMKPGRNEFRSRITEWVPDRIWSLEGLAGAFGLDLTALPVKESSRAVTRKIGECVDPMLSWLSDNRQVVEDNGEWVKVVCPWDEDHSMGDGTAGYSPLGRGSGDWVMTRSFNCLHESHKDKKLEHYVEEMRKKGAPVVLGYDPLPYLQDRFAYIGMGQEVADLHQRKRGGNYIWSLQDWTKRHPGQITVPNGSKKIGLATAFVSSKNTNHLDYSTYIPVSGDTDTGMLEINGQKVLNTYRSPNWDEVSADPAMFLEHMDYLIPDKQERELVLNWLAFKFQNPALRSYAVVMVADGVYGTGRSWLIGMLRMALQGMVNTASLLQLLGKGTSAQQNYNDWKAGCQFLVVEEAKEVIDRGVFYQGYEQFKQEVDIRPYEARINPKFGRTRMESIYFNALIFTNHKDALTLPENDRRVCVVTNPSEMNTAEYYDRLEAALSNEEAARLYWWMMRRDVSGFDHVYPPMTPGKTIMIEQNRAPSEEVRDHIYENCPSEVITKKLLREAVKSAASILGMDKVLSAPETVENIIWKNLVRLRDDKNGARYVIEGELSEVRAIRNHEVWKDNDEARDKEKFENELSVFLN